MIDENVRMNTLLNQSGELKERKNYYGQTIALVYENEILLSGTFGCLKNLLYRINYYRWEQKQTLFS